MPEIKNTLQSDEYDKLIKKAQGLLSSHPHLDPYDIVNDVVLAAIEKGEGLYLHELIKSIVYHTKSSSANKISYGLDKDGFLKNNKFSKSEHTRVCAHCHEIIPISGFSLVRRNSKEGDAYNVVNEILYNCKECQKKIVAERIKTNRGLKNKTWENANAYNRKYMKEYRKRMSEKQKLARKEYAKKYASDPANIEKQRERQRKYDENKRSASKTIFAT
jgi:vacuolar-type H+-ATPase subunit H